jgi:hypothetical protein
MMAVAVETDAEFSFAAAEELFAAPYYVSASSVSHSYDVSSDGRFLMIRSPEQSARGANETSIVVVQN